MKNTPSPQVHVDFRFTAAASALLPRDVKYDLDMPYQGGLPMRGDLVTITAGNHQITFRVVRRNFELLSGITTIRIDLGTPEEAIT
jgi:hypothetical protein